MRVYFKGSLPKQKLTERDLKVLGALSEESATTANVIRQKVGVKQASLFCTLMDLRERKMVADVGKVKNGGNTVALWKRTPKGTDALKRIA